MAANSDDTDDKAKVPVVQQRGRFKVTSENVDPEKVRNNFHRSFFFLEN
jgi:serine/threonine-protein kinase OSR1/STK39